jgi:hypothetical protein
MARQVSDVLGTAGCVSTTVVALHAVPAPEAAAGFLGILRTGATCLLLDPRMPLQRRVALAERAGATVLLAGPESAAGWPENLAVVDPGHGPQAPLLPSPIRANAAAVLLDTAGDGTPPAPVVLSRSALADLGGRAAALPGLTTSDAVAWRASGPAAWLLEVCAALLSGAPLLSDAALPSGAAPQTRVMTGRATVAYAGDADVAELRAWAATSGTPPRAAVVAGRPRPGLPFPAHFMAGPVEAGYPVNDTTRAGARTTDGRGRLMPAGHSGRLCVTGAGLATGYAGDPARTADRFRPDPFADRPGARVFLDDETARVMPDGHLELVASPADPLFAEPAVADAVVATVGGRRIAMVVPMPDASLEPAALLRRARAASVPHRSPVGVVVVPRLPRTGSGLVDREALAGLAAASPPVEEDQPDDEVCNRIAAIWAGVLGCTPAEERGLATGGRDFFELGGHSLFAVSAALRISEAFGVEVPARWIFDEPTVPEFAARLARDGDQA